MLGAEKRKKLAKVLAVRGKATSGGAGTSTQPAPDASTATPTNSPAQAALAPASPLPHTQLLPPQTTQDLPSPHATPTSNSPLPIAATPLTVDRTSPAPQIKGKGVVIVPSDEKDSAEGLVFKRRRTTTVAASHSASNQNAESLRENPLNASTPPHYMALGEGTETAPESTPGLAPELPKVVQSMLKGFQQAPLEGPTDEAAMESVASYLGEFFAHANYWRHQAEVYRPGGRV